MQLAGSAALNLGVTIYSAESYLARTLARASLAGCSDPLELRSRCYSAAGGAAPWLVGLTHDLAVVGASAKAPNLLTLTRLIRQNPYFQRGLENPVAATGPRVMYFNPPTMDNPPEALAGLAIPALAAPGDLARWLGLSVDEMEWLANRGDWRDRARPGQSDHYRYRMLRKSSGGLRLLEIPKTRLLFVQRRILRGILAPVPLHPDAHGAVPGRSIVSNAEPHVGRDHVLRVDLKDFFVSIPASRVCAIFTTIGYPLAVARYLTALTTHAVPAPVARALDAQAGQDPDGASEPLAAAYRSRHLPQGAPTSAALANLAAFRLDVRLAAAARECGAHYTRYVDDLYASTEGLTRARMRRIALMVYTIALEEGFEPNVRKTRVMPAARAQRVTGVMVNVKPNVNRREFDRLKAILWNCRTRGPTGQDRSAHADFKAYLGGRVAFVEQINAARGAKLRRLYEDIRW